MIQAISQNPLFLTESLQILHGQFSALHFLNNLFEVV